MRCHILKIIQTALPCTIVCFMIILMNLENILNKILLEFDNTQFQKHPLKSNNDTYHNNIILPLRPILRNDQRITKKDWHDYKEMAKDRQRIGVGEQGKPAYLPQKDKVKEKKRFMQFGYNALLSENILLNRSVPDIRHKGCHKKLYLSNLPSVSVVIPFYNEQLSVLFRSIYSILNRSPPELIYEIILVDDFSDKVFLGEQLDQYVADNFRKVKIIRLHERSGLIVARLAGVKIAKAEVLVILDSHIEVNHNWLPPLLEPIVLNPKTVVCPFIDVIDDNNFEYRARDEGGRGAFNWDFLFRRIPIYLIELKDRTKPYRNPIMGGGLFAISIQYFWELGGYDEGLDIWGGEQYELSFKIWMCGGEILDAPCSRVGHHDRGSYGRPIPRTTNFLYKNYKRVAEVWMDEYAKYIYNRYPKKYESIDPGDLTKQKSLRKRLKCKSFKWFLENIAYDLLKLYPPIEPQGYAFGIIQSLAYPHFCLDSLNSIKGYVGLNVCTQYVDNPPDHQIWALSWLKDLRLKYDDFCLDVSETSKNSKVNIYLCHGNEGNQQWFYDQKNKWLIHYTDHRCLEANLEQRIVYVNDCDESNVNMKWNFTFINTTALNNF